MCNDLAYIFWQQQGWVSALEIHYILLRKLVAMNVCDLCCFRALPGSAVERGGNRLPNVSQSPSMRLSPSQLEGQSDMHGYQCCHPTLENGPRRKIDEKTCTRSLLDKPLRSPNEPLVAIMVGPSFRA